VFSNSKSLINFAKIFISTRFQYFEQIYINVGIFTFYMKNLIPTGSAPGKIYELIKVCKENYPARPVVSMVNTPEYHLAEFLDSIIKPYNPRTCPNQHMIL